MCTTKGGKPPRPGFPNKLQLAPTIKGSERPCPKIPRGTRLATYPFSNEGGGVPRSGPATAYFLDGICKARAYKCLFNDPSQALKAAAGTCCIHWKSRVPNRTQNGMP